MLLQLPKTQKKAKKSLLAIPPDARIIGIDDVRHFDEIINICAQKKNQIHLYCSDLNPDTIPLPVPHVQGSYSLTIKGIPITLSLGRPAHIDDETIWLSESPTEQQKKPLPYYSFPSYTRPNRVDIVGAGISGLTTAYVLAQKGIEVRIFDRHNSPCQEASGNPHALVYGNLSPFDQIQPRFYMSALFTSLNALSQIAENNSDIFLPCGIRCSTKHHDAWHKILAPSEARIQQQENHLWLPNAGVVNPHTLAQTILAHPKITLFPQHEVDNIIMDEGHPTSIINGKRWKSDHLVICAAHSIRRFSLLDTISVQKSSGQISYTQAPFSSNDIAYSNHAYLTPFWNGVQCFGSTYHLHTMRTDVTEEDHLDNILRLQSTMPNLNIQEEHLLGRCGIRAQTNNFLPIIGPLPNKDFYTTHYSKLRDGLLRSSRYPPASYIPNLSVHLGHGSKGFSQAWLGAEILTSQLTNTPLPIDTDVYQALHPARYLVRSIHKNIPIHK